MTDSAIVIGSGIIGCAIARALAMRGVRCTVCDLRPLGGGATQASAGMLAPYVEAHAGGPMLDLCIRSLGLFDGWILGLRAEGEEIEYARIGTLEIALSEERAAALRGGHGEWMPAAAVAAAFPQLAPTAGALRNDLHGYADVRQLTKALARSAERHGATFVAARAERIQRAGDLLRVVTGGSDSLEARHVIVASGAWTNAIHGITAPPIRPVRGQLLHVEWPYAPVPTILWGPDCYIVPLRHGARGLLVGATVEDVGFDEGSTEDGVRGLLAAARALLPALAADSVREVRVGLRPATRDELPVLGRDPAVRGVVHASGHYRNGVLLSPITAALIADLVVDDRVDPLLTPFRPDRL